MTQKDAGLTGKYMGGVLVLGRAVQQGGTNEHRAAWSCRCECGKEMVRDTKQLKKAEKAGKRLFCGQHCESYKIFRKAILEHAKLEPVMRKEYGEEIGVLQTHACYWCGKVPHFRHPHKIRRIHSNGPWKMSNLCATCNTCDRMRGAMPRKDFLMHLRLIAERHLEED
jgi:hypothetical protein